MILKYIEKQLKLRTIRILREKHLMHFTCIAVSSIRFGMDEWYRKQVEDFAKTRCVSGGFPFFEMSLKRNTHEWQERKIFLDWLEQEVMGGRK